MECALQDASGKHQFYHPLKAKMHPTDKSAGEFMIAVFLKYQDLARKLETLTFTVTLEHGDDVTEREVRMSSEDCQQLQMWLIFATNACMHEKMFSDFYKNVAAVCTPTR